MLIYNLPTTLTHPLSLNTMASEVNIEFVKKEDNFPDDLVENVTICEGSYSLIRFPSDTDDITKKLDEIFEGVHKKIRAPHISLINHELPIPVWGKDKVSLALRDILD